MPMKVPLTQAALASSLSDDIDSAPYWRSPSPQIIRSETDGL